MEAVAAVCVTGILLAVFVPAFLRELRTSKTSEASNNLALLYQRSAAYFAEQRTGGGTRCLPDGAGPAPRDPTIELSRVDFTAQSTPGSPTWRALGFAPRPLARYAYTFEPASAGCGLRSPEGTFLLTLRAEGDLDGDGERSIFERRAAATEEGELVPFDILYVRDRME